MSQIQVDNIYNKEGDGSPGFPLGANVTGVITATTFKGGAEITSGTISATSVTATTGTFTSNVSIGGTLTYEDVTNIDSVGLITARNGINVSGGTGTFAGNINANGNIIGDSSTNISGISSVTATNFYGNGASLSGIEAAPTIQGVANGTIASEAAVIVESDGKVAPITPIASNTSAAQTAMTDLFVGSSYPHRDMQTAYDTTTGRVAVIYRPLGGDAYIVVGTRSSNSITWGTPATLTDPGTSIQQGQMDICCIGAEKFFVVYSNTGAGYCQVITTTSSNTFTAGTRTAELSSSQGLNCPRVEYDSKNDGVFVAYNRTQGLKTRYATVSGTDITISAEDTATTGNRVHMVSSYDATNGYMLLTYSGNTGSIAGDPQTVIVYKSGSATLSGSANSPYPATGLALAFIYNSISNRYYAFYTKNNNYVYYKMGTLGSYQVSWGTEKDYDLTAGSGHVALQSGENWFSTATDLATGKIFIQYMKDSKMQYQLNNTSATFELNSLQTATDWNTAVAKPSSVISMGGMAFTYGYNNTSAGTNVGGWQIKQFASTDLTLENFIGFSKAGYTNGQTATVKVVGNVTTKSGLTPGKKYYVQNDGTVSTTAGDPSVVAGRALTSTSLLIQPV